MRGQVASAAQEATVARLRTRGWRRGSLFALHVPMYRDRPLRFGRWAGSPDPCVVRVDRAGNVRRGYPR